MTKIDKNLFWDIDFEKLDYKENAIFIIRRVLLFGDKKDYDILKKRYSYEKIKGVALNIDYPDKKNANFLGFIFNFSSNKKCTKK
ncbi:MAG: hypothetical protein U9N04_04700, partial [Patescibacteria group bacterium]|nr:hypothetical protein [Patescibacteria group bacterium]